MLRLFMIIVISIVIFKLTCLSSNELKITKAVASAAYATILCFAGPYIIEYVESLVYEESNEPENIPPYNDESFPEDHELKLHIQKKKILMMQRALIVVIMNWCHIVIVV